MHTHAHFLYFILGSPLLEATCSEVFLRRHDFLCEVLHRLRAVLEPEQIKADGAQGVAPERHQEVHRQLWDVYREKTTKTRGSDVEVCPQFQQALKVKKRSTNGRFAQCEGDGDTASECSQGKGCVCVSLRLRHER